MSRKIILTGALLMALAVIFGAFGAHALKSHLSEGMMQVYNTGVEYHFYHALGLLLLGALSLYKPSRLLGWSAIFLAVGVLLFSGSLYALSITGIKPLGIITPFGGLSFIGGWVLLIAAFWRR